MDLHVSLSGRRDLCGQVYRQLRTAIMDGRLQPSQALPSTRDLAARLAVSRNTVAVAYDRLVAEGFLISRVGTGTFVSNHIRPDGQGRRVDSPLKARPVWEGISPPPDMSTSEPEYDFRVGVADVAHFPFDTWRALVSRQLRPTAVRSGAHIDAAGHPAFRSAIARHIAVSRAVRAAPEDVFVTNGSQQAIDLVSRLLLEPGDTVAVEDPGYPPPRRAFIAAGARVVGVPVDAEGLIVDAIPRNTSLVYVSPSHQFPLGMSMSLPRRLALLEWAERANGAILEDDYDSEFRYGGRPLEPLQSLDHTGRVLYVGSLSKVMLPTLRLGFVVAPASLHGPLRKAKHLTDWHTEVPAQAAAAEFINAGLLARHIRRMRNIYFVRHQHISAAVAGDLADHLIPIPSAAGLHLTALLRHGTGPTDRAVARRARRAGVEIASLSEYAMNPLPRGGLLLGYGAIPAERIAEGLRRLGECLDKAVTRP